MVSQVDLTGYHLTFDAEMTSSADMAKFANTFQNGDRTLYNNHEAQAYANYNPSDPSNPYSFANGALTITAKPVPYNGQPYTSGLLQTSGSFTQNKGYFEIRAQIPDTHGFWSAFWMLAPNAGTPELDMMEQPNNAGDSSYWTFINTPTDHSGGFTNVGVDLSPGYHTYGLLWTAKTIQFTFDGQLIGTPHDTPPALVGQEMYLLANLAVGNSDPAAWPGQPANGASANYDIDYIRAYSNDPSRPAVAVQAISSPDGANTTPSLGSVTVPMPVPAVPTPVVTTQVPGATTSTAPPAVQPAAQAAAPPVPDLVTVAGTPGDDVFTAGSDVRLYAGDGGHDVLMINEGRRGAIFSLLGGGDVSIQHGGRTDIIRGIEEVRFLDGREVFDGSDPAAVVTRLYQAALSRAPDQAGLNVWTARLQAGAPLSDLANGFLSSPEFIGRFGTGLSNADFVTRIYQNVLGRAPDAAGLAAWSGSLEAGQQSRGQVLAGISESPENQSRSAGQVAGGIWDVSEPAAQVARLYDTALGRLPDISGLDGWTRALNAGASLNDVAGGFINSAEFRSTYGILDDRSFVDALYTNTLHRPADAAGAQNWTNALAAGASRTQVLTGFSESLEHQMNTQANIMSNDPNSYGIRLA